jgi:hypothetical protein
MNQQQGILGALKAHDGPSRSTGQRLAAELPLRQGLQRAHQAKRTDANLRELEMGTTLTEVCVTPGQCPSLSRWGLPLLPGS